MCREYQPSFNGNIIEIPSICVDNFNKSTLSWAKAYFLSHFHTDHTVGLDKDDLRSKLEKENNVFIYATKMTAAIIVFKYKHLEKYVKVLKLGSNLIVIPGDTNKNASETILSVTLIPAGHCLGSSMFLFETTSVKVLYTGDFRIRCNDNSKYAAFHDKNGGVIKLDALYVDTTFIETKYASFPKRSESTEEALIYISKYLESDENQFIILNTSANYAYEFVFNKIYERFGMKVYVDDEQWRLYSQLQNLIPGVTNNANETRIYLKKIPETRKIKKTSKQIRFSAFKWDQWNEETVSTIENKNMLSVCFPTHCSRTELLYFVEYLNPAKVVGFPNQYLETHGSVETAPEEQFVMTPKRSPKKVPDALDNSHINDKKVDNAVIRKLFG